MDDAPMRWEDRTVDPLTEWRPPDGRECEYHPGEPAVACVKYADGWHFLCDMCAEADRDLNG